MGREDAARGCRYLEVGELWVVVHDLEAAAEQSVEDGPAALVTVSNGI